MYVGVLLAIPSHLESGGASLVTAYLHKVVETGQDWSQCTLGVPVNVIVAQKSQSSTCGAQNISLSNSVLNSAPFPPSVRAEFEAHLTNGRTSLIQRVSNKGFVIATTPSSESPLGLLHARISPTTFSALVTNLSGGQV